MANQPPTPSLFHPAMKLINGTIQRDQIKRHAAGMQAIGWSALLSAVWLRAERSNHLQGTIPSFSDLVVLKSE